MVLVRKLCKIWTFGDESSKPVFEQKPVFFRRFSWKTEPAQSVRDLTFGTEGCRFESCRVCFLSRKSQWFPALFLFGDVSNFRCSEVVSNLALLTCSILFSESLPNILLSIHKSSSGQPKNWFSF